jgi:hypothetical protein
MFPKDAFLTPNPIKPPNPPNSLPYPYTTPTLLHNERILESQDPELIQCRKLGDLGPNHLLGGIVLFLENTRMLLVAELEKRNQIVPKRLLGARVRDGLQALGVRLGSAHVVACDAGGLGGVADGGVEEGEVRVVGGLEGRGGEGGLAGDEGADGERHGWFLLLVGLGWVWG